MALRLSGDLQKFKEENEALQMENKYLRDSKLALIKATAEEIERLRRFISLLANALRGGGFTVKNIRDIARNASHNRIRNNKRLTATPIKKKKTEWKYKQKQIENRNNNKMIKSQSATAAVTVTQSITTKFSSLLDANEEKEPQKPMSLKERMNALQNNSKTDSSVNDKISALRAERNLNAVKVTTTSKDNIASLFADKIQKQKKNTRAASLTGAKGKILKEALKNPQPEKAAEIVQELGLFVAKEKKPNYRKNSNDDDDDGKEEEKEVLMEVLNMNNNIMMKKMSEKEKENMENLICDSLINNQDLKQVQMCNADINDKFLKKILDKLAEHRSEHNIKELWLESNPIGNEGMKYLAEFLANDDRIEIVKLYNNKKTISTQVLNELLDGLSKNQSVVKFVFDGFRFQHQKDKKERYLRRNAEIARRKRNEEKKRLKALQNQ